MGASIGFKLAVVAIYTALAAFGGGYLAWHWQELRYVELQNKIVEANLKAEQLSLQRDQAFQQLGDAQTRAYMADQAKQAAQHRALQMEVRKHVPSTGNRGCITVGFIRVLDAAGKRTGADSLPLPAGLSDDSCAPMGASDVAERLIANIANFHFNATQLDALSASARELKAKADQLQPKR